MRLLLASLLLGLALFALGLVLDGQVSTLGQRPAPAPVPLATRPDADDVEGRLYHHVTIPALAHTTWTHAEIRGLVTLVRDEPDGDVHIRVEDPRRRFAIVEIIPAITLTRPKVGDCVRARGIVRFDKRHLWTELHPAESLEIFVCSPLDKQK